MQLIIGQPLQAASPQEVAVISLELDHQGAGKRQGLCKVPGLGDGVDLEHYLNAANDIYGYLSLLPGVQMYFGNFLQKVILEKNYEKKGRYITPTIVNNRKSKG